MWKCGCFAYSGSQTIEDSDCKYKHIALDKCCYRCEDRDICNANVKCTFGCDNAEYWEAET